MPPDLEEGFLAKLRNVEQVLNPPEGEFFPVFDYVPGDVFPDPFDGRELLEGHFIEVVGFSGGTVILRQLRLVHRLQTGAQYHYCKQ